MNRDLIGLERAVEMMVMVVVVVDVAGDVVEDTFAGFIRRRKRCISEKEDGEKEEGGGEKERPEISDEREKSGSEKDERKQS